MDAGAFALEAEGEQVIVVAPDRPGLLSLSAGVLARFALRSYFASPLYTGEPAAARAAVTFEPRIVEPRIVEAGRD